MTLPYAWAESFWIALLVLVVLGASVALACFFAWRFTPLKLLALFLFVLACYPVLRGLFLGQFTLLVFASFAFGVILLARQNDELGGWVLAISTVKPHIAIVVLATISVWVLAQRRWRVLRGFASAMAVLGAAATILLPSWFGEFVGAVNAYSSYIQIGPPLQVLSETFLPLAWATPVFIGGTILLFGVLVYRIAKTLRRDMMAFIPTIELAMLVTAMTMVRTATTDQTMLLIPWVHWLGALGRHGWQVRAWLVAGVVVIAPWVVFLSTLNGNQEAPIATTTFATMTLIVYGITYWRD
jgi:Glycosyltransferase family 87